MRPLGKLDRYVAVNFLASYTVCFFFFLGLFVVIDLVGRMDDILESALLAAERGASLLGLTARYYLVKVPGIFLMVAPYLTVMAAMFSVSRLRKNNEIVPMIMSGVSLYRVLAPIFVLAGVFLCGMVLLQEYVAPRAAKRRMLDEAFLIHQDERLLVKQEVFRDAAGREVVINNYDVAAECAAGVEIRYVEDGPGGRKIEHRLHGRGFRWLGPERSAWSMEEGVETVEDLSDPGVEPVTRRVRVFRTDLIPGDILARIKEPNDLTFRDIRRAYAMNPRDLRMKILLHYHITFPLSNLLLLLLGLPFVLRFESRSHYLGLVMALLICGGYFVLDVIMRDLGTKGQVHPVLAAWFSSIFCGAVGIYLYDGIRT